jgi:hypothetical protein
MTQRLAPGLHAICRFGSAPEENSAMVAPRWPLGAAALQTRAAVLVPALVPLFLVCLRGRNRWLGSMGRSC